MKDGKSARLDASNFLSLFPMHSTAIGRLGPSLQKLGEFKPRLQHLAGVNLKHQRSYSPQLVESVFGTIITTFGESSNHHCNIWGRFEPSLQHSGEVWTIIALLGWDQTFIAALEEGLNHHCNFSTGSNFHCSIWVDWNPICKKLSGPVQPSKIIERDRHVSCQTV